jgi:hypothetical protein
MTNQTFRRTNQILFLALAVTFQSIAADGPASQSAGTDQEINQLKSQLAEQQQEIQELRTALVEQRKLIEATRQAAPAAQPAPVQAAVASPTTAAQVPGVRTLGEVASTTPILPPAAPAALPPADAQGDNVASPLQIHIGDATITPVAFMDFTSVFRTTNVGSSIGTNFGGVPFNNAPAGKLSEFRESAQNSRLGLRVDATVHGARVLGYMESDFLGFTPTNVAVTSNSDSLRLRLYWVDVQKSGIEIMGGQSWSMLTPNRNGLSPLPADIFYSQLMDTNYQLGLTWSRQAQFRIVAHPNNTIAAGISIEEPEQYIGGTNGIGAVSLPSALSSAYSTQLNSGATNLAVPNVAPDIIGKVAFDPRTSNGLHEHIEVAGLFRSFKVFDPSNGNNYDAHGFGGSLNLNLELVKGFHLISNNFFSDGGGRYIFGQVPDLVIRGDGSISPVHAGSTVDGFEYEVGRSLIYAYYGGVYSRKDYYIDPATGKPVGWGYSGSGSTQNRIIQEPSFGLTQTFWKDGRYGALQLILQYSYLTRDPFIVPSTASANNAHSNMFFADLRYVLPGSAPTMGK